MDHHDLPTTLQRTITHQFYQARHDMESWMRLAATVLAKQSKAASLVTAPQTLQARFKHLELLSTSGRQVLMVLVLMGGVVKQQMLVLAEPVTQEKLSATAELLTKQCSDKNAVEMLSISAHLDDLGQDILTLVREEMIASDEFRTGDMYREGLANVLAEPEFAESDAARNALKVLEEKPLLEDLLKQAMVPSDIGGVQVLIGGEGTWDELRDFSMVLARYGVSEVATGTLGVLGPIRMPYSRTISTVRFVSQLMSNLVSETLTE
jgi:heat-inducible transcriptional repressor